jgi:hypothetical protein
MTSLERRPYFSTFSDRFTYHIHVCYIHRNPTSHDLENASSTSTGTSNWTVYIVVHPRVNLSYGICTRTLHGVFHLLILSIGFISTYQRSYRYQSTLLYLQCPQMQPMLFPVCPLQVYSFPIYLLGSSLLFLLHSVHILPSPALITSPRHLEILSFVEGNTQEGKLCGGARIRTNRRVGRGEPRDGYDIRGRG